MHSYNCECTYTMLVLKILINFTLKSITIMQLISTRVLIGILRLQYHSLCVHYYTYIFIISIYVWPAYFICLAIMKPSRSVMILLQIFYRHLLRCKHVHLSCTTRGMVTKLEDVKDQGLGESKRSGPYLHHRMRELGAALSLCSVHILFQNPFLYAIRTVSFADIYPLSQVSAT